MSQLPFPANDETEPTTFLPSFVEGFFMSHQSWNVWSKHYWGRTLVSQARYAHRPFELQIPAKAPA
jgi:hypothetical protein